MIHLAINGPAGSRDINVRWRAKDLGLLILRFVGGGFVLPHSLGRLFGWFGGPGLSGFGVELRLMHLPSMVPIPLAFALVLTLAGIALVIGLWTRASAVIGAIFLAVTVFAHAGGGWFWIHLGIEYPVFWSLTLVAIALTGAGGYSVDRWRGRDRFQPVSDR